MMLRLLIGFDYLGGVRRVELVLRLDRIPLLGVVFSLRFLWLLQYAIVSDSTETFLVYG